MKREEFLAYFAQDAVCIIDVLDAAYLRQICLIQIEIQLFPVLRSSEQCFSDVRKHQKMSGG